jgi:hypothetical protein
MKTLHLALALLIFLGLASALSISGPAEVGRPFSISCEGKSALVSSPNGSSAQLALNSSGQAEFVPQEAGQYAVRCGNGTKTLFVRQAGIISSLALFSIIIFIALMAAASVYVSMAFLGGSTRFSKEVSGSTARLTLRADRDMERIEISDPVRLGHEGKSLSFSIPALKKGEEWSFEYRIASPKKALPASLTALAGGKEMSLLSELRIDAGEEAGSAPR